MHPCANVRRERGELGEDHHLTTAHGRAAFAAGDRIQFTGTDKRAGLMNGTAGTIEKIDGTEITMKFDGRHGAKITFDAKTFDKFRHGYAGTIYAGQGATLDQTYLYHTDHWRSASSYVALTRHRDKAEIFVATNTLNTRQQAEPWMMAKGGEPALGQEHYDSARRSYEHWKETNPTAAARHGFADYVQYVQDQWAKKAPEPENDRAADLRTLARQMGRVDDRRAASMFHHQQDIGPVRPLTARETLEKFGGAWSRPPEDRRASGDQAQQRQARPHVVQDNEKPQPEQRREQEQSEARRAGTRGPDDRPRTAPPPEQQHTPPQQQERTATRAPGPPPKLSRAERRAAAELAQRQTAPRKETRPPPAQQQPADLPREDERVMKAREDMRRTDQTQTTHNTERTTQATHGRGRGRSRTR